MGEFHPRRTKSQARIKAFNELVAKGEKRTLETAQIVIPTGPRLGDKVIVAENLSKAFGDKLLIDNFSCRIPKGAIVGIIGPNGAGKSTTFGLLSAQLHPSDG